MQRTDQLREFNNRRMPSPFCQFESRLVHAKRILCATPHAYSYVVRAKLTTRAYELAIVSIINLRDDLVRNIGKVAFNSTGGVVGNRKVPSAGCEIAEDICGDTRIGDIRDLVEIGR